MAGLTQCGAAAKLFICLLPFEGMRNRAEENLRDEE
jgi:hypothetical protein